MWFTFVVGILLVIAAALILFPLRSTEGLRPMLVDGVAAVLLFPVLFRILRFFRLLAREPGDEAFP